MSVVAVSGGTAALQVDLELAKAVANSPEEEDEALRRKLWLCIARRVVQRGQRGASTNGVIKANGEQRSDVQQQEDQAESIRQVRMKDWDRSKHVT